MGVSKAIVVIAFAVILIIAIFLILFTFNIYEVRTRFMKWLRKGKKEEETDPM